MTVTVRINNDRDQSIVDSYDCDLCDLKGCERCTDGKIIFRSSKWEVNMANGNFSTMMSALGISLPDDDYCGSLDPRTLLAALDRLIPDLAVRATHEDQGKNGGRIIHCGIDQKYVTMRTTQLRAIAMEAARREETISWG